MTATASHVPARRAPGPQVVLPAAPRAASLIRERREEKGVPSLLPDVSRVPVDPAATPAARWPTPVQRCGIGSSCGCPPDEKLSGFRRDLREAATGGISLPDDTRRPMEAAFGTDFRAVRVHTGSGANQAAITLHARALTAGTDILFRYGAYRPGTVDGDRLLAHELAHVVQQARGLRPDALDSGPGDPLERSAAQAADHVAPTQHAVPVVLPPRDRRYLTAGSHPAVFSMLGPGRPLTLGERNTVPGWGDALGHVRVHDDWQAQLVAALLGDAGLAAGPHVVLSSGAGRSADRQWLLAHELTHVMQQQTALRTPTPDPEREADRVADFAAGGDRTMLLPPPGTAPLGLAEKVIARYTRDLPNDMLLIIDVDDGDFVGGCVKAIVPHVGAKLILKNVPKGAGNQLFNIHTGITTNAGGETCFFFYESVSGLCDMFCFPTLDELKKRLGEIRDWLKDKIEKVLRTLLPVAIAVLAAYLIADAIVAALALAGILVLA